MKNQQRDGVVDITAVATLALRLHDIIKSDAIASSSCVVNDADRRTYGDKYMDYMEEDARRGLGHFVARSEAVKVDVIKNGDSSFYGPHTVINAKVAVIAVDELEQLLRDVVAELPCKLSTLLHARNEMRDRMMNSITVAEVSKAAAVVPSGVAVPFSRPNLLSKSGGRWLWTSETMNEASPPSFEGVPRYKSPAIQMVGRANRQVPKDTPIITDFAANAREHQLGPDGKFPLTKSVTEDKSYPDAMSIPKES